LREIEKKRKENVITGQIKVVGCARLGTAEPKIKFGTVNEILKEDFGPPLHCIIIPGKLHFVEEEMLQSFD
jgi:diphthine synthase